MLHLPINLWGQFKLPSFQTGSMPLFWRLTIFETWSLSKVSSFRRFSEVLPRRFVASPVGSAMPSTASHCKCRINFPNSYEFHALFKKGTDGHFTTTQSHRVVLLSRGATTQLHRVEIFSRGATAQLHHVERLSWCVGK